MGLLCQGKEQEAALRVPRGHEAPAGAGRGAADLRRRPRGDAGRLRLRRRDARGLPAIGYPALPSKADGYVAYYDRLNSESHARLTAADAEYDRLVLKLQTPDSDRFAGIPQPGVGPLSSRC
jgi:hypothetical protein